MYGMTILNTKGQSIFRNNSTQHGWKPGITKNAYHWKGPKSTPTMLVYSVSYKVEPITKHFEKKMFHKKLYMNVVNSARNAEPLLLVKPQTILERSNFCKKNHNHNLIIVRRLPLCSWIIEVIRLMQNVQTDFKLDAHMYFHGLEWTTLIEKKSALFIIVCILIYENAIMSEECMYYYFACHSRSAIYSE